jgi:hypothetical protein
VRQWIDDNLAKSASNTNENYINAVVDKAIVKFDAVMVRARRDPDLYSPRYLLTTFMGGGYKREILPMARTAAA